MPNITIDITEIIITLIGIVSIIITSVIIPWFKAKTSVAQQDVIRSVVSAAVYAAQQLFTYEWAEEKKNYAIEQIKIMLSTYNITLNENEISTYIEGVLKDIKTKNGVEW